VQVVELLARHGGNISAVAREMGRARVQIRRWIKRFQIAVDDPDGDEA
jgi:transposase-like protein